MPGARELTTGDTTDSDQRFDEAEPDVSAQTYWSEGDSTWKSEMGAAHAAVAATKLAKNADGR